jgi:predicted dehydrogenase
LIRVALLGAGIGAQHLAAYRSLTDVFDVVAICDRDLDRARSIAGGIPTLANMDAAIKDPSVDLIDICLPPHLHVPVALRALAAGKSVICEKPIATSLADMDRLDAEQGGKARVFPVFQYRFGLAMAQLHALEAAGLLGAPHMASLETHWRRDAEYYAIPWRGTWAGEQGGAILGHAIHLHDWLSFVLGPVASVYAVVDTRVNDIETEDCAGLTIRMENGAIVTSSVTLGAADDTSRLRFVFEGLTAESGRNPYRPAEDTWTYRARAPKTQASLDATLAALPKQAGGYHGLFQDIEITPSVDFSKLEEVIIIPRESTDAAP